MFNYFNGIQHSASYPNVVFVILLSLLNSGCMTTYLEPPAFLKGEERLIESVGSDIQVCVKDSDSDNEAYASLGHQYLFFLIPFGEIGSKDIKELFYRHIQRQLAIKGLRAIPCQDGLNQGNPKLDFLVEYAQASAYDFLFFRRIYVEARARAYYFPPNYVEPQRMSYKVVRSGRFADYAFKPQLEREVNSAISEIISSLVSQLLNPL